MKLFTHKNFTQIRRMWRYVVCRSGVLTRWYNRYGKKHVRIMYLTVCQIIKKQLRIYARMYSRNVKRSEPLLQYVHKKTAKVCVRSLHLFSVGKPRIKRQLQYSLRFSLVFSLVLLISFADILPHIALWFGDQEIIIPPETKEAYAVEVTIEDSPHATDATLGSMSPNTVFTSDSVGYVFYPNSSGSCGYRKTSDGGATWGGFVTVDQTNTADCVAVAVWHDRWTPGDEHGNRIHVATIDNGTDDTYYTEMNLVAAGGPKASTTVVTTSQSTTGVTPGGNWPSVTKATNGDIYVGAIDSADSWVIRCAATSTCTTETQWYETHGGNPWTSGDSDSHALLPLPGGKVMAIQLDQSTDTVQTNVYTGGISGTWSGMSSLDTSAADNTGYSGIIGATLDKTTGTLYLAYGRELATFGTNDDIYTWRYEGGSWTQGGDIITNNVGIGGGSRAPTGLKLSFNENNGNLYAVYTARTTAGVANSGNIYYLKSSDRGVSWGTESAALNASAADLSRVSTNITSKDYLYTYWLIGGATDDVKGDTVVNFSAAGQYTQERYRWRANNNTEASASFLTSEDAPYSNAGVASTTRLRVLLDEVAVNATTSVFNLQYATSTAGIGCGTATSTTALSDWQSIPKSSASSTTYAWRMSASSYFTDRSATTNVASGLTDPVSGTGSSTAGQIMDKVATTTGISVGAGNFVELEWSLTPTGDINSYVNGRSYCFRVAHTATSTNFSYLKYPKINLASSTQVTSQHYRWRADNGFANSFAGSVNGATTTFTPSAATVLAVTTDNHYVYAAGYQTGSGAGHSCGSGITCWRVAKYDINTGLPVSSFGTNGATTTFSLAATQANAIAVDSNYIYVAGFQTGSMAGDTCTSATQCWRVAKYDITTGAAVTAFGGNGATTTFDDSISAAVAIAVDSSYVYVAGNQVATDAGEACASGVYCWRINKYDITTGAAVTAFGGNGATTTFMTGGGEPEDIAVDASAIYVAGYQTGAGAGDTCTSATQCWRVAKYDITTGAAVTAFGGNGATTTFAGNAGVAAVGIGVDSSSIYVGGNQIGPGAGEACASGVYCWRINKYDITTGAAVTAFGGNGATTTFAGGNAFLGGLSLKNGAVFGGGYQTGSGGGSVCTSSVNCWRVSRIEADDGSTDQGASWLGAEDVAIAGQSIASTTRLRILVDQQGTLATTTIYQLEYATSTVAGYSGCSALSSWVPVAKTASSTSYAWKMTPTSYLSENEPLLNSSGLLDPSSSTFVRGVGKDRVATTSAFALGIGKFTELEWSLQATSEALGNSYCFRLTNADSATNMIFSVYPRISLSTTSVSVLVQNQFRFYQNADQLTPSTAWDSLAVNESISGSKQRITKGSLFRLRVNITVSSGALLGSSQAFAIQYAQLASSTCSTLANSTWTSVGSPGDSQSTFRLKDNSFGASQAVTTLVLTDSDKAGLYSEANPSGTNPNAVSSGEDVEYDWPIEYSSSGYSDAEFCFRMVKTGGTVLDTYTRYPQVLTAILGGGSEIGGSPSAGAHQTGGGSGGGSETGDGPPSGSGQQGGGGSGGGSEVFNPGAWWYFANVIEGLFGFVASLLY